MLILAEAEQKVRARVEVWGEQFHLGVCRDTKGPPRVEGWVVQHLRRGDAGVAQEVLGLTEVVLGSDADDLNLVDVGLSKLLNGRAFAPAGRSMRCPEPEQYGTVASDGLLQTGD